MIAAKALRLAGPGARLVARPGRDVAHVYTGPLTPSGRFVPRSARTVCRAHTRRLSVLEQPSPCSMTGSGVGRVCARCSACLLRSPRAVRQAEPHTAAGFRAMYADLDQADVAAALLMATTPAEADAAAHLSLALFGVADTLHLVTARGRTWPPLAQLVHQARERVHGFPESLYVARDRADAQTAAAREVGIARAKEIRADREARIERLGFTNAKARDQRGRKTPRGARP